MKLNLLEKAVGSTFFTGYVPFASGTVSSAIAFLIYWIPGMEKPVILIPVIVLYALIGIGIGSKFELAYGKDPSQCTIDEAVGTWISLLFLPKTLVLTGIAFLVWRVLDIIKPYPANKLESLNGGLGIMADDIASGIYTCLLLNIVVKFFIKG